MKDEELLQDALGQIGDDLILEGNETPKRKTNWLPRLASAAACFALLLGLWQLMPRAEQPGVPTWPDTQPTTGVQTPTEPEIVNLWEREGFRAYSLIYSNIGTNQLSADGGTKLFLLSGATEVTIPGTTTASPEPGMQVLQTAPILLSGNNTVKVESLIAGRYVAYLTEDSVPVFYDTQEGVAVDLKQRILGDDVMEFETFFAIAADIANKEFPGMLETEENMDFFREKVFSYTNGLSNPSGPQPDDWPLNTDFMDALEAYKNKLPEERPRAFSSMCWTAFCLAQGDERYEDLVPYRVQFLAVDPHSGKCMVWVRDIRGNGLGIYSYDIGSDQLVQLNPYEDLYWRDASVRYSADGKYLTVAWNRAVRSSQGQHDSDVTQKHLYYDTKIQVGEYVGERVTFLDLANGWVNSLGHNAASEGFLSPSGNVCYYKLLPEEAYLTSFTVSSKVWSDRLTRFDRDTDVWVVCTSSEPHCFDIKTALTGNFVRLICNETVAVMERGGEYYAYLLGVGERNDPGKVDEEAEYYGTLRMYTGEDITEQVRSGQYPVAAHERLRIFLAEGHLYKQDLFSGDPAQKIARADQYILSSDGLFAFVYSNGSDRAECYNVVTLESCAIALDPQLWAQLRNTEGAVFRMTFNESDNSLVLSFYSYEDDVAQEGDVDFFGLLLDLEKKDIAGYGSIPVVYTDRHLSEEGVEILRKAVQQWPDLVYPQQLPKELDAEGLLTALEEMGVTISLKELSVNGTRFILYDQGNEKVSLYFHQFWGLYDYPREEAGFHIECELGGYYCIYEFQNPRK